MRLALLSDAHGNPVGVRSCLRAVSALSVDAVYFLGDAVGYLPGECEVLELLSDAGISCQTGNHEAMILARLPAAGANESVYLHKPAAARLGEQGLKVLRDWPDRRELEVDGHRLLLVHGSPSNPLEGYCYPDSDISDFAGLPYDVIAMGHTHRPFVRRAGKVLAINAGSCGLPRDQGDSPCLAVYDTESDQAAIYRVRIDPEEVLSGFHGRPIHDAVKQCLYRSTEAPAGEYMQGV